jgi:hypothetical protein
MNMNGSEKLKENDTRHDMSAKEDDDDHHHEHHQRKRVKEGVK